MTVNGFAGVLIPSTVTVYLGPACDFRYGLGAFSDLTDGANIRVVGLLLKNSTNGQLVLLARHIDGFAFHRHHCGRLAMAGLVRLRGPLPAAPAVYAHANLEPALWG